MADTPAPFTVLVVDDAEDVLNLVELTLQPHCAVKRAQDGRAALRVAFEKPQPDLVLLDVEMPGSNGYDVCRALKASPALADVPVIFLTSRSGTDDVIQGFQLGAIDYFHKPVNPPVLAARVRAHIELIARRNKQEEMVVERSIQLEQTRLQLIRRLGRAMEYHETSAVGNRVVRLGHYARHLAQAAGAKASLCDMMMKAAPLHDIGKLGVPASILRKTEKLSVPEREQMQRHAEIGAEIIGEHDDPLLKLARTLALTHHERWDGRGYPSGAKGNDIPWAGRVMAVADVFEGMTATQFHRGPIALDIAAGEIIRGSGTQFDPQIVEAFKKALPAFRDVRESYADALGDMLDLDFSDAAPAPKAPEPVPVLFPGQEESPEPGGEETMRTLVSNRALQALREADEARARTLAKMQAKLKVERDLAAAAAKDLSTQQAARKRGEEAAAREAEALELTRRRMADELAAANAARERARVEADAAATVRRAGEAKALLIEKIEARAKAEEAQARAQADRRAAEEATARLEVKLAAAQVRAKQPAKQSEAAAAACSARERAELEAKLADLQQQLSEANAKLVAETQAREKAEQALAAASKAPSEETLRRAEVRLAGALEQAELAEKRLAEEATAVRRMAAERAVLDDTIVALEQQLGAVNERRSADDAAVTRRIAEDRYALEERLATLELDLDAANAKAAGEAQAREKAERALGAASTATADEALQRTEVKLAAALEKAVQAEKQLADETTVAKRIAQERALLQEKLDALERDFGAANARAAAEAEARQSAEQALAAASKAGAARRSAEEALERTELNLAATLEKAAQAEKREAEDAVAAKRMAEERAALEATLTAMEEQLGAATAKAVAETRAREKAEQALAATPKPRTTASSSLSPAAKRTLVYVPVALAAAVVSVALYLSAVEETPVRAPKAAPEVRAAPAQPIAVLSDGEPLKLRLDGDPEKLAPREPK